MRTILSLIHLNSLSHQPRLRMRLISSLGLLVVAAAIFASPGKARIEQAPAPPMPGLRGVMATEYLKQQGLYNSLGEAVKAARYGVYPSSPPREGEKRGEAFYADNPRQRWRAGFTPHGLSLRGGETPDAGWEFGMRLRSAGYGERQMAVNEGRLTAKGARIESERTMMVKDRGSKINPQSAIIEWYVNKAEGLEQGFTLAAPVAERVGEEPLVLRLELTGDLQARAEADGQSVALSRKSGMGAVTYNHLAAVDAEGRKLAARLEAAGSEVRIVVDDSGASYPVTIDPTFTEVKKLTASDGSAGDGFGISVAIYADTAIVGAAGDDIGSNGMQGSAYIFERNQGGPNNWSEVKKLTASDGGFRDFFGLSVAIYADTAIVGALRDKIINKVPGSAYIFERNQGGTNNWGEVKKLTPSVGSEGDQFGASVAIYADTAIVGAREDDIGSNDLQGSAYIYERNQGGANNWGEVKKLTAPDGAKSDIFGGSVAIYGDTAVVGAPHSSDAPDSGAPGAAYIFERNQGGANNWGEVKKLTASDGVAFDFFGGSVAIYAGTTIVGSIRDIRSGFEQGSAYIYERNQGGANTWGEVKKLTASDGAPEKFFGSSMAVYADTAIVWAPRSSDAPGAGVPGAAYIFERNQGGANNWGEVEKLTPSDGVAFDLFGGSVAIYAGTFIIGTPENDIGSNDFQGSAYVFSRSNQPPDCSRAQPSVSTIWPPNHEFVNVTIQGVTDPDGDPVSITIDQIKQDEPTDGVGDGHTCPDAGGIGASTAQVRAERSAVGNGRVYTIFFTASDGRGGSCQGSVTVCVPRSLDGSCVDDGPNFDSTDCSGFSGGQFCFSDLLLHLLGLPCLP